MLVANFARENGALVIGNVCPYIAIIRFSSRQLSNTRFTGVFGYFLIFASVLDPISMLLMGSDVLAQNGSGVSKDRITP